MIPHRGVDWRGRLCYLPITSFAALSKIIADAEVPPGLTPFDCQLQLLSKGTKALLGIVYTPAPFVNDLCRFTFDYLLSRQSKAPNHQIVHNLVEYYGAVTIVANP